MIKSVLSGSWGFSDAVAQTVPLHRGGVDAGWMNKRAAAPLFDFEKLASEARPDETLVHLLALGDGESIGANRNGDFFPSEANRTYHPTFLKANYYHNHDNKDSAKAFGRVAAAAHNGPMGRVELIVGLDNKKAADDIEELEKSGEFPVSMSCAVPHDICAVCSNKARTRAEYCKHARDMMGQIMEDGKVACVINDHPNFFDISKVKRGADRIAFTFDKLRKAASEDRVVGGAELAEILQIAAHVPVIGSVLAATKRAVLEKLAAIQSDPCVAGLAGFLDDRAPVDALRILKTCADRRALFGELHRAGVCLPLLDFLELAGIEKPAGVSESTIRERLTDVFSRLAASPGRAEAICRNGSYDGTSAAPVEKVARAVRQLKDSCGLTEYRVESQILLKAARNARVRLVKSAGFSPESELLADEYAAYLLSFAARTDDDPFARNLTALRAL